MEKARKEKISFYTEIGQYFAPDGSFDPRTFSDVLASHLSSIRHHADSVDQFQKSASKWIERYVSGIVEYLRGKNMLEASYGLVKQTVDTCISFGINSLSIPPDLLEEAFSQGVRRTVKSEKSDRRDKGRASGEEKRRLIFGAALHVFAETGFHKATMDRVAQVAGIGKGSLYRMFTSKDELLEQLLDHEYRKVIAKIGGIFTSEGDLYNGLREMIEFWVTYIHDNPVRYRLLLNSDLAVGSSSRTLFYDYMNKQLPMLKERIVSLNEVIDALLSLGN
ncbi:MAG: TetR/AcrR family transcriptional regulator, partial [Spirochaetota bacterium]